MHVFVHALGDVVGELVDLFSDVAEPRVARPTTNKHDGVDWYLVEIHCHCCARADGMRSDVPFFRFKRSYPTASVAASSASTICLDVMCSIRPLTQTADTFVSAVAPSYPQIR